MVHCGLIMNEILTLRDVLRYTKYDTETGVIILINDVLNLHLRPASIDQIEIVTNPNRTTVSLTTKLDQKITDDGGKLYIGDLLVTFDKMDVSKVYPGGFSVDSWMGLDSILMTLYSKTRVRINKDECDLIETQGLPVIRFKETSVFWRGDLDIKLNDLPIIVDADVSDNHTHLVDLIDGDRLFGFADSKPSISDKITGDVLNGFNNN